MNIELRIYPEAQAAQLRRFVEHRIEHALGGLRDQTECVQVDIGAARDAGRRGCRVRIEMPGQTDVVVEDSAANVYVAIHRALDRAAWMAESRLVWSRLDARVVGLPGARRVAAVAADRAA